MKKLILILLTAFTSERVNCQCDLTLAFLNTTDAIWKQVDLKNIRYLHQDNIITNSNDKKKGVGFTDYYWIEDSVLMIANAYSYKIRKLQYIVFYKNNKPIYYQNKIYRYSIENIRPKKIFHIDSDQDLVLTLLKKKVNIRRSEWILKESKSLMKYWHDNIKDFEFK